MTIRRASIFAFLSLSLLIASCAEGGGGTLPGTGGTGAGGAGAPRCGDGVVQAELGEVCECDPATTDALCPVTTADCSSLDNQTGALLCDRTMCMYNPSMCMSVGVAGTTGGGGAGG